MFVVVVLICLSSHEEGMVEARKLMVMPKTSNYMMNGSLLHKISFHQTEQVVLHGRALVQSVPSPGVGH